MPPFRSALDALAALTVPGVAHNYALNAVPDDLVRVQLPALLVLPAGPDESPDSLDRGSAFQPIAFSGGPRVAAVAVTHLLLVAPVAAGPGRRAHLPALVDLMDAYLAALAPDVTLGGALVEPLRLRLQPGVFTHGRLTAHGCAFRHFWLLHINAS